MDDLDMFTSDQTYQGDVSIPQVDDPDAFLGISVTRTASTTERPRGTNRRPIPVKGLCILTNCGMAREHGSALCSCCQARLEAKEGLFD